MANKAKQRVEVRPRERIDIKQIDPIKEYLDHQVHWDCGNLEMGVAQSVKHNLATKTFKITLAFVLNCGTSRIADYRYDFLFEVDDLNEFQFQKRDGPVFSMQFIERMVCTAYSTLRGILYCQFSGTRMSGFMLPVLHAREILKSKIGDQIQSFS